MDGGNKRETLAIKPILNLSKVLLEVSSRFVCHKNPCQKKELIVLIVNYLRGIHGWWNKRETRDKTDSESV